jgi:hypothetical protein
MLYIALSASSAFLLENKEQGDYIFNNPVK